MSYPGEKTSQPSISAYPNEGSIPVAQGVYTVESVNGPLASQIPTGQVQHYQQTMGPTAPPVPPTSFSQQDQNRVSYQQTVVNYSQQQQQYQQPPVNYSPEQQQYSSYSQQQPVNYPQQQQQYQQPPVNYPQQQQVIIVNSKREYGHVRTQFTCPNCRYSGFTQTRTVSGACTWFSCVGLALFGCWPCCCVPFCGDCTKDTEHYCPNCKTTVGIKRRI